MDMYIFAIYILDDMARTKLPYEQMGYIIQELLTVSPKSTSHTHFKDICYFQALTSTVNTAKPQII